MVQAQSHTLAFPFQDPVVLSFETEVLKMDYFINLLQAFSLPEDLKQ